MLKIEPNKRYRIRPDGTAELKGDSSKLVDVFGSSIPNKGLVLRTPFRAGESRTVNVKATNIRVRWNTNKLLSDENKCKRNERKPPFRGGQVETSHIMFWRALLDGAERLDQDLIPGKMISPTIEFDNNQTVYFYEAEGEIRRRLLLGLASPRLVAPRIIGVERLDGGDVNEAGDLEIPQNYYCTIRRTPTYRAGTNLSPRDSSLAPRTGTALWERSTAQYQKIDRNQPGDWKLEVT